MIVLAIITLCIMQKGPKKVLVPIFNRAHYGRLRSVLRAIKDHPHLELSLITASPLAYDYFFTNLKHSSPYSWPLALKWYIRARLLSFLSYFNPKIVLENHFLSRAILNDGFNINARIPLFLDGGSPEKMVKMVGLGLVRLANELKKINPDIVFINADRFEMMAVALAAAYLNIPIAHNEGGDVSGTIDESVRHAITKLAHLHFTSSETSKKRVIQMGENPENVFLVGSPAIDVLKDLDLEISPQTFPGFDFEKSYLVVLVHPITTESQESNEQMARNVIGVIEELALPTIFIGSNIDAGSGEIGKVIREWNEKGRPSYVAFAKSLGPDNFYRVLAKASCALGNSSSFIREGAYFGTPVVLIGSRQENREKGKNVKEVGIEKEEIKKAVLKQIKHGQYSPDFLFGDGGAGEKIAAILAEVKPSIQKKFFDL